MAINSYWVADVPVGMDTVEVDLPGVDLTDFTDVTAVLLDGEDEIVPLTGVSFLLDPARAEISIDWGTLTHFATPGLYHLQLVLVGAGTVQQRLAPEPVVVEEVDGWHSMASTRALWADAPFEDADLYELLIVSKDQCIAYAPALDALAQVPANYRKAQISQARNIWNSTKVDPETNGIGGDGFVIRTFPMDWAVKNLLRPKRGVPVVG